MCCVRAELSHVIWLTSTVRIRLSLSSASLSFNIASVSTNGVDLPPTSSVGLSVCLSVYVWKVYCVKTADWIRMPFGMVSGVSRGMGVLDRGGDRRRGRGSIGVEFRASHYNQ